MAQAGTERVKGSVLRGALRVVSRPLAILLLLQLVSGILLSPQRTFFPIYLREVGHPILLISALATAQQVMGLLGSWVGGGLSDALGRKPALLIGQVGSLLASLSFLFPSLAWIAPLWVLAGFCGGIHTVSSQSYLIDAAHSAHLGMLSALYNWGSTLGGAVGSPVAGLVLERWDYRVWGMVATAIAALAIIVNALVLPRTFATAERHSTLQRTLLGYGEIARRPTAFLLALLRFLPTCYWGMAILLMPLLLTGAGASKAMVALYATVSQVSASAGQILVGHAADRLGRKGVTVATFVALILSILGTALSPDRLRGLFVFGTAGTTAAWSLSTLMPSLVAHVTAPRERGRVLGWVHLWWNLGMIVGSMAGGFLSRLGAGLPFLVAAAANAVAVSLVFLFFRLAPGPDPLSEPVS